MASSEERGRDYPPVMLADGWGERLAALGDPNSYVVLDPDEPCYDVGGRLVPLSVGLREGILREMSYTKDSPMNSLMPVEFKPLPADQQERLNEEGEWEVRGERTVQWDKEQSAYLRRRLAENAAVPEESVGEPSPANYAAAKARDRDAPRPFGGSGQFPSEQPLLPPERDVLEATEGYPAPPPSPPLAPLPPALTAFDVVRLQLLCDRCEKAVMRTANPCWELISAVRELLARWRGNEKRKSED